MKRLTLDEIMSLPKASVIWREEHTYDEEEGFNFYEIEPMLISVPGRDGVLCYASKENFLFLNIDEDLINPQRNFWDSEPAEGMIKTGLPMKEFDSFHEHYKIHRIVSKDILSTITCAGYTLDQFCQKYGIALDELKSVLIGEKEPSQELRIVCKSLMSADDQNINLQKTETHEAS